MRNNSATHKTISEIKTNTSGTQAHIFKTKTNGIHVTLLDHSHDKLCNRCKNICHKTDTNNSGTETNTSEAKSVTTGIHTNISGTQKQNIRTQTNSYGKHAENLEQIHIT